MATKESEKFPKDNLSDLDWIILKKDMENEIQVESKSDKFMRKFKENPLVPIGR